MECYILEFSTKSWKEIKQEFPNPDTLFTKSFFITIHQQPHFLMVAFNHTRSYLFQSQNNSWIENHNPIVDHDFLIDADQVSIFQLSNIGSKL